MMLVLQADRLQSVCQWCVMLVVEQGDKCVTRHCDGADDSHGCSLGDSVDDSHGCSLANYGARIRVISIVGLF